MDIKAAEEMERLKCRLEQGMPFKLQNGLNATLYALESGRTKAILDLCSGQMHMPKRSYRELNVYHCAVAVEIDRDTVWLIFPGGFSASELIDRLETDTQDALTLLFLAVHDNRLYVEDSRLMAASVQKKTSPYIAAVLSLK